MSTVDADVESAVTPVREQDAPTGHSELTTARLARVGDMDVRRLLPMRRRRSVGAWCFVDHYGPMSVDGVVGMRVPPHPHMGLQTVTWLLEGDVLHRDSLGTEQMIRPGQLNLMTAGHGIAHSESSPTEHDPRLHGVQLWLALPDADRAAPPRFEHHTDLPVVGFGGLRATVFAGRLADVSSPAGVFSPVVGAEISAPAQTRGTVPLARDHEHVLFVAEGSAHLEGRLEETAAAGSALTPGGLLYLSRGRDRVSISATAGTRLLLLGGEPFGETLLMWWNFVGRTPEEIATAAAEWQQGSERFGPVPGFQGSPLPAPPLDAARLRRPSVGPPGA